MDVSTYSSSGKKDRVQPTRMDINGLDVGTCTREEAMTAVESIIGYQFANRTLLETALTHSSFLGGTSYERLEFVGDSALGHLLTTHLYTSYPNLDQGALTLLRAANVSTEKLARAAVKLGLYQFLRRNSSSLDNNVMEFANTIGQEDAIASAKPPKVLADIIESVAAAVYVDSGYNLDHLWLIVQDMLAPIVTPETLQNHPWTELLELCQKFGKELKFVAKLDKMGMNVVNVVINGAKCGTGRNENKNLAKNAAAREALEKLKENWGAEPPAVEVIINYPISDAVDEDGAKHKLNVLCGKMRWPFPMYRLVGENGPGHDKKFISSVEVTTLNDRIIIKGDMKGRVKESENSAAQKMLYHLRKSGNIIN